MRGCGLILAAGGSTRFGSDKRRAPSRGGRTLLETTIATWQLAFDDVQIVLRDAAVPGELSLANQIRARFPALQVTFAARWEEGMGASLAAGMHDCTKFDYVVIGLGDMPFVQATTLRALDDAVRNAIAGGRSDCIVRPRVGAEWGQPVGFGRGHFPGLMRLGGDRGARDLIAAHGDVLPLPCTDQGVLRDVDTPDQLDS